MTRSSFAVFPLLTTKSYLPATQGHLGLCTQATVPCLEAEFMGETASVDLGLGEKPSYLELCFDALIRLTGGL